MEFLIDLVEESRDFARGRPGRFLYLPQRLPRLQQVFIGYQGPCSETVEPGRGARSLRAGSCGCPREETGGVPASGGHPAGAMGFDPGAGKRVERLRGAGVEMVQVQVNLEAGQDAACASGNREEGTDVVIGEPARRL